MNNQTIINYIDLDFKELEINSYFIECEVKYQKLSQNYARRVSDNRIELFKGGDWIQV